MTRIRIRRKLVEISKLLLIFQILDGAEPTKAINFYSLNMGNKLLMLCFLLGMQN